MILSTSHIVTPIIFCCVCLYIWSCDMYSSQLANHNCAEQHTPVHFPSSVTFRTFIFFSLCTLYLLSIWNQDLLHDIVRQKPRLKQLQALALYWGTILVLQDYFIPIHMLQVLLTLQVLSNMLVKWGVHVCHFRCFKLAVKCIHWRMIAQTTQRKSTRPTWAHPAYW